MAFRSTLALCLLAAVLLLSGAPARAAQIDVPGNAPTIQAAIDAATDGTVIQLAPGVYHERPRILAKNFSLVLRGNPDDPSQVVLDGDGVEDTLRLVDVGEGVVLEGMTITGGAGYDGHGGGMFIGRSQATFRRMVFRDNTSTIDGGGAFVFDSGGLFQDCEFRDNVAPFGGGMMVTLHNTTIFERCTFVGNRATPGIGGAMYVNDSSVSFISSVISDNRANIAGGGAVVLGHWVEPEANVTFHGCTFEGNVAEFNPPGQPGDGGAMHIEDNVSVTLSNTIVRDNTGGSGGGLSAFRAHFEVRDSIIEQNHALLRDDGSGGYGGGVHIQSVNTVPPNRRAGSMLLVRSAVRDNDANIAGGVFSQGDFVGGGDRASLQIEDSLIADNTAVDQGGGVEINRTVATIRRSHVVGNTVDGFGAGVMSVANSDLTIEDSTLADNATDSLGGGIFADLGGSVHVTGSRIVGNRASATASLGGGAIAVGETPGPTPGAVNGTVSGTVIADNGSNHEIWEASCTGAASAVTYVDNALHSDADRIYYRNCDGGTATVGAFNALGGKASGNSDELPSFAVLLAAPAKIFAGGASALSSVVRGGGHVTIDPDVGAVAASRATIDVSPLATTTYTLDAGGAGSATATVEVGCADLGIAVPKTPANGGSAVPGDVALTWHAATGATSYDVYLDAGPDPVTLVAQDTTATSLVMPGLPPNTGFRWRIVAKNPTCGSPSSSPVFSFATCGGAPCELNDGFDDGDASDWTIVGRGTAQVVGQRLQLEGKPRLTAYAPGPRMGEGMVALSLTPRNGSQVRLIVGYQDEHTFVQFIGKGRKWKLLQQVGGRTKRLGKGKSGLQRGQSNGVRIDVADGQIALAVAGQEVVRGTLLEPIFGGFGVQTVRARVEIDDVQIVPRPAL